MSKNLKKTHPQKYYIKLLFGCLYYLGLGDWWYEPANRSDSHRKLYKAWACISNVFVAGIIFNEILANSRNDLTDRENNDLVQFTFAHLSIYSKIIAFYVQKSRMSFVFMMLLDETRSVFFSDELDRQCVKQFMRYSLALVGVSYVTLFSATIDAIRAHFIEGIPIRTEVTFFPRSSDTGLLINVFRFFIEFHWWYLVGIMVVIDCLAVASLVFVSFKFKLLQVYFTQLREKVLENYGKVESKVLEDEFKKDFVVGVKLHAHALWCARNVQGALGSLYSIQVFESVALMVMCLVKLVTTERNMIFLLANFAYICCLIVLTGAYMMPAGDVTHEASQVSTAIFHCGWEFMRADSKLRVLTVFAIQQSQVRVYMTAFGIMTLSYNNFISVLRSSYSFFAVMY